VKRKFLGMVAALALLDLAGDATQILTIVFVAQYSSIWLVFVATCVGLIAATAMQTILGKGLGKILTPQRIRYVSIVVFLLLGGFIIVSSLVREVRSVSPTLPGKVPAPVPSFDWGHVL